MKNEFGEYSAAEIAVEVGFSAAGGLIGGGGQVASAAMRQGVPSTAQQIVNEGFKEGLKATAKTLVTTGIISLMVQEAGSAMNGAKPSDFARVSGASGSGDPDVDDPEAEDPEPGEIESQNCDSEPG